MEFYCIQAPLYFTDRSPSYLKVLSLMISFQEDTTIKLNETASDIKETATSAGSVVHCICSLLYISHVIWYCILNTRIIIFMGTIVPQLLEFYPDDREKGNWKWNTFNAFVYALNCTKFHKRKLNFCGTIPFAKLSQNIYPLGKGCRSH